ncbi:RNA polymerase sigma factor (sigma-70 family) [Streptomyces sp. SLBN-118]|uniref:RNA polymerase sigma factor n=1 Tax=Streptomyces sp. SLBN-118 TaxID=2768454 RepID=UPI00114FF540|nr:sigma-70 family RNA polymerase sigma factor [Streptomyces sp. SLBN-118]TQK51092.1 RNA polymerase sigma factor (sigma-70 family) [Streptomyces sp. SLBN-118]
MATDTGAADDRWQRAWSHREQLLKVARRRSMSMEDAEDAVHEAMLRAAEHPELDDERLGAWLTTVTMRLCVDRYRQVNRESEVRSSPTLLTPVPVPVEEAVCDRAEARWLAVRSGELPARQAEALWLKSEDLDVGQVAVKMGLSYRTVESLLARARRTLRHSLAATLGGALWLIGHGRRGGNAHAVAVASTAATLAVAGLILLPHVHEDDGPGSPRPASPAVSQAGDARQSDGGTAGPTAPTPTESSPTGADAGQPSGGPLLTYLPGVSLPPLPPLPLTTAAVPDVPEVLDVPAMPEIPVPGLSGLPSTSLPSASLPSAPGPSASLPSTSLPPQDPSTMDLPAGDLPLDVTDAASPVAHP